MYEVKVVPNLNRENIIEVKNRSFPDYSISNPNYRIS